MRFGARDRFLALRVLENRAEIAYKLKSLISTVRRVRFDLVLSDEVPDLVLAEIDHRPPVVDVALTAR